MDYLDCGGGAGSADTALAVYDQQTAHNAIHTASEGISGGDLMHAFLGVYQNPCLIPEGVVARSPGLRRDARR